METIHVVNAGKKRQDVVIVGGFKDAQVTQVSVDTSAIRVDVTPLSGRISVEILYPKSTAHSQGSTTDGIVWVGFTVNMSATSQARELQPGESWRFDVDESVAIYCVANNAAQMVTISEFAL